MKVFKKLGILTLFFIFLQMVPMNQNFLLWGADHADAPVFGDPLSTGFAPNAADITDTYFWISGSNLVMVLCVTPLQPAITTINSTNVSKYLFNPEIAYQFHVDNSSPADGIAEFVISCRFSLATSPNFQQYIRVNSTQLGITNLEGEINTPLNSSTAKTVTSTDGTIKIFAGPRDDPFFFDFVGFKNGNIYTSNTDTFRGTNVSAIVIEMPLSLVKSATHNKVALWCTTYQ